MTASTQRVALRGGHFPGKLGESLLEDGGFRRGRRAPSIYLREEDGVEMSLHVDDLLVIGLEGLIRALFEWLGQCVAVTGLETLDPVRGLNCLGVVHYSLPGGHLETTPSGYIEFVQSLLFDWGESAEIDHFVDNSGASTHGRRIGTRYLWEQEELRCQRLKLTKVKGMKNATDVATKLVDAANLKKCMTTIGLISRTRFPPMALMA